MMEWIIVGVSSAAALGVLVLLWWKRPDTPHDPVGRKERPRAYTLDSAHLRLHFHRKQKGQRER